MLCTHFDHHPPSASAWRHADFCEDSPARPSSSKSSLPIPSNTNPPPCPPSLSSYTWIFTVAPSSLLLLLPTLWNNPFLYRNTMCICTGCLGFLVVDLQTEVEKDLLKLKEKGCSSVRAILKHFQIFFIYLPLLTSGFTSEPENY